MNYEEIHEKRECDDCPFNRRLIDLKKNENIECHDTL